MDIRPLCLSDNAPINTICTQTALQGNSAETVLHNADLPGSLFAEPYLHFEPDVCFAAFADEKMVGYMVATSMTQTFERWLNTDWLPKLRKKKQRLQTKSPFENQLYRLLQDGLTFPTVPASTSHGHISILPSYQSQGLGRELLNKCLNTLRAKGSKAIFVDIDENNLKAIEFFTKRGFTEKTLHTFEEGAVCLMKDLTV